MFFTGRNLISRPPQNEAVCILLQFARIPFPLSNTRCGRSQGMLVLLLKYMNQKMAPVNKEFEVLCSKWAA